VSWLSWSTLFNAPGDFKRADMVMHIKEPLPPEYDLIREDQIVFTYLHLAAAEELTHILIKRKAVADAFGLEYTPIDTLI
jgi:alanine dehydrogenase